MLKCKERAVASSAALFISINFKMIPGKPKDWGPNHCAAIQTKMYLYLKHIL